MAIDKAVDSQVLDGYFSEIAKAIRAKNGGTAQYTPSAMATAIRFLKTGVEVYQRVGTVTVTKDTSSGWHKGTIDLGFPPDAMALYVSETDVNSNSWLNQAACLFTLKADGCTYFYSEERSCLYLVFFSRYGNQVNLYVGAPTSMNADTYQPAGNQDLGSITFRYMAYQFT